MKKLLLVCLVLWSCTGCSDPPPKQGYVRDKRFEAAHWESGYRTESYEDCGPHIGYDGKVKFSCETATRQVYEAHHEYIEDRWWLFLEDCRLDDKGKNKCNKGWLQVDETDFHRYGLDTHYPDAR